jgi:hypothetical protein
MSIAKSKRAEPATPEEIRRRIAELKERSNTLLRESYHLAERSVADPAAEKAYQDNIAEGTAIAVEVARLEKALEAMSVKAAAAQSAAEAAIAAAARERVAGMLDDRLMAARDFEEAIAAAVEAMRRLATIGEEIGIAWPGNAPDSMAAALAQAAVLRLCGAEMYRQAGQPIATGGGLPNRTKLPLPAPKPVGFQFMDRPEATPALTAAVTEANTFAKQLLEGRPQ